MKAEIIASLEQLLESDDIIEVQKEFKKLSTQYKSLLKSPVKEADENGRAVDSPHSSAQRPEPVDSAAESKSEFTSSDAPSEHGGDIHKADTEKAADASSSSESIEKEEKPTADANTEGVGEQIDIPSAPKESISPIKDVDPNEPIPTTDVENSPNKPSSEDIVDPLDERFHILAETFKAKLQEAKVARKKAEEETLAKAKDLLEELEKLVSNEENIGKAFSGFNAIKEHWKALPKVSNDDYRELNMEYNKLVERFFYNINIYKELKDLDLKHNLEQKLLVMEDHKKLLDLNDIRLLEVEVRMNQDRWNEIGPTFKDDWEKLKDEFWTITRAIYSKIQVFYDQRREDFEKNFEAKKALLEEARRLEVLELKSPKKWQEKTKAVIDLQQRWKMIGFVPKEKAGPIWKEFRKTCDAFFEKKRQHFAEIHAVHEANRIAKEQLVTQAEHLKDSQEWNESSNALIKLQNDWKKIGPAHQRDDNALWRRFRAACDHFFTSRNAQKSGEVAEQSENLVKKKALIEKIEAHQPGTDSSTNIEQLKAFGEEWRAIGHVPFKEKDAINKLYKKVMDHQFDSLKIERKERQKMQFEEKVENLKEARGGDRLLQKEEDFIRNKINKIKAEINQYENNMGFFANSKSAEKLKEEVIKKIDKAKSEVDELQEQLQLLRNA
jgi:hypothetical protein